MDTKDHLVISVLQDTRRFIVPIYQRQYSWGENRLLSFWYDVVAKAEQVSQGEPKFNHYMGALILAPGGDGFKIGATPKVQVVDGQQRLTTFQIFLVALREVGKNLGRTDIGDVIKSYLFVNSMIGDTEKDAKFKLIPTPQDRDIFHLLVDGGMNAVREKFPTMFFQNDKINKSKAPLSVRALSFFTERVEKYVYTGLQDDDDPVIAPTAEESDVRVDRLNALLEAFLKHLAIVVITLSEKDDAQVIFETLNSKAEPLLAMDLVRNNIFQRAASQGESAEALFEEQWQPFDTAFWKVDAPRAKPRRPRIDHFLSHALTAQKGEETSLRELYAEYRAFTRPKGQPRFPTVSAELEALTKYRPIYQTLEEGGGDDKDLRKLGQKLNLWEVSTAYPLVFQIASSSVEAGVKAKLYLLIYSYLVRRAVCGLTAKAYNKTFASLCGDMLKKGVSVEVFEQALSGSRGDTIKFPSDEQFRSAILSNPVYNWFPRKERLADILWELELSLRTKYSVATPRPENMSIEHVLPQMWEDHWPLPDGRRALHDSDAAADDSMIQAIRSRREALHTLGNLTLVTVPGNSVASNSPFDDKRHWLKKSLLALNLAITEKETWDEEIIHERGKALADIAIAAWPGLAAVR